MGFRRSESGKPAGRNMSSPAEDPPKGLFFFWMSCRERRERKGDVVAESWLSCQ